jgi:hypothetical protein
MVANRANTDSVGSCGEAYLQRQGRASHIGMSAVPWAFKPRLQDCFFDLPNRVTTSFTSVGNSAGSRGLMATVGDVHSPFTTPARYRVLGFPTGAT